MFRPRCHPYEDEMRLAPAISVANKRQCFRATHNWIFLGIDRNSHPVAYYMRQRPLSLSSLVASELFVDYFI